MKSSEVRQKFFEFFEKKGHKIVPSAPMVIKNDPTLMFTNAGMNQFKDYFLGNSIPPALRVADTQKCLRVSGKHNDLEEVGHDTYHHTMFEMLGNWSFGDYFKKEAIEWAWELLTEVYKIDKSRLYVTVFGGDQDENLPPDKESIDYWKSVVPEDKIILGSKKDNFWEMGETGPCGPCSEIHIDLRSNEERKAIPGQSLVNMGDPLVIELWNLVFIQYNRQSDSSLSPLPNKHVDTGMGFERLSMVMQGKRSNYETDIFQPIINKIAAVSGVPYGQNEKTDIAMRVIADHLRAVAFSIADGQLPSNNKAGYVIRRILRRAIRYGYTYLDHKEPFIHQLVPVLSEQLGLIFPELKSQQILITKVIYEEENAFLNTLETGIKMIDQIIEKSLSQQIKTISGKIAFELYDTYGFPFDLTALILKENDLSVNRQEFDAEMSVQKNRSRSASVIETDDWVVLIPGVEQEFIGYDYTEADVKILQYRQVKSKDKKFYQLVFNFTPFYAESGGQVGDTGYIESEEEKIEILNTKKENELIVHITEKLPADPSVDFRAFVDLEKRENIANNHSATHLLHHSLRQILGKQVEQKGSLVQSDYLRFDFSHFQKLTENEIREIEILVNRMIRENIRLDEKRAIPIKNARELGAIALFGEKYGDTVRVIKFADSIELCGGTHVNSTGKIGFFRITSESAIAAGIRRIEAVTAEKALVFTQNQTGLINEINSLLNVEPEAFIKSIESLLGENKKLRKDLEVFNREKLTTLRNELIKKAVLFHGNTRLIIEKIHIESQELGKDLVFDLNRNLENAVVLLASEIGDKAYLWMIVAENIVQSAKLNASDVIREMSKEIEGGGGGQPFFATAGGKNPGKIMSALEIGKQLIISKIS